MSPVFDYFDLSLSLSFLFLLLNDSSLHSLSFRCFLTPIDHSFPTQRISVVLSSFHLSRISSGPSSPIRMASSSSQGQAQGQGPCSRDPDFDQWRLRQISERDRLRLIGEDPTSSPSLALTPPARPPKKAKKPPMPDPSLSNDPCPGLRSSPPPPELPMRNSSKQQPALPPKKTNNNSLINNNNNVEDLMPSSTSNIQEQKMDESQRYVNGNWKGQRTVDICHILQPGIYASFNCSGRKTHQVLSPPSPFLLEQFADSRDNDRSLFCHFAASSFVH